MRYFLKNRSHLLHHWIGNIVKNIFFQAGEALQDLKIWLEDQEP